MRRIHPSVARIADKSSDVDPLSHLVKEDGDTFNRPEKVLVAQAVAEADAGVDVLDMAERLSEMVDFIRASSREVTVVPVDPEAPPVPGE